MQHSPRDQMLRFDGVERVVADPLRLKLKLAIGEDAYAALRVKRRLQEVWDVGGVAATGGAVAASSVVAGTFFAPGGWLAAIGLGTAAVTPLGWIIGAAVVSGGAYYGVIRLLRSYSEARVQVIPAFINTPMDLLGASLFDMMGALALKVAAFGGPPEEAERACLKDYFVNEWGLDRRYVDSALPVIEADSAAQTLKDMAVALARFSRDNPDCNYPVMHRDLIAFLREIAQADGHPDERKDLAIETVDRILRDEARTAVGRALHRAAGWAGGLIRRR